MTDGIYAVSKMLGDVKFHEHKDIDSAVADKWKKYTTEDSLGDVTWQLAESLGYEGLTSSGTIEHLNQTKGDQASSQQKDDSTEKINAGKNRLKQLYQRKQRARENG